MCALAFPCPVNVPVVHFPALGSTDRTLRLYNLEEFATERIFKGHRCAIAWVSAIFFLSPCYFVLVRL